MIMPVKDIPKPGPEYHTGYVQGYADAMRKEQKEREQLQSAICPDGSITDVHGLIELVTEMRYFFDRINEGIEERGRQQVEVERLKDERKHILASRAAQSNRTAEAEAGVERLEKSEAEDLKRWECLSALLMT